MHAEYLKRITLFLTILVIIARIIMAITCMKPFDIPISTANNTHISFREFIIIPGRYYIILVIERNREDSYQYLNRIFGDFGCWNVKKESPCGQFENYEILWSLKSRKQNVSGTKTPLNRSGSGGGRISRAEYVIGIAKLDLNFGYNEIDVEIVNGLSDLKEFPTRLAISPEINIKGTFSGVNGLLFYYSFPLFLLLLPIVTILWLIYFIWFCVIKLIEYQ